MNRQTPPKPEASSEDTNRRAPGPRDEAEVVEANRAMRDGHPEAAHHDRPLIRPRPSALDQELAEAATHPDADPADVRAGPGDAGGQRSPNVPTREPANPRRSRTSLIFLCIILAVLAVAMVGALL
ncbi:MULTISPECIES: hypothetical protein [unclassified Roseovarius]|uniref:hypothetical protein n=1 Tax=unclassified Roseovarius TaxID=2614913 RepID=UPI00273F7727|nr:hypothetical protein [Roseovarius sp. MMSF_3350]